MHKKYSPKTLPKQGQSDEKIDGYSVSAVNINFFGFRLRFRRVWDPQVGPKLVVFVVLRGSKRRAKFERIFERIFSDLLEDAAVTAKGA